MIAVYVCTHLHVYINLIHWNNYCFTSPSASSHRELVKPYLERLLTQLEISFNAQLEDLDEMERRRQDALDITCLQVMRAVIHNEVMRIDPMLKVMNGA